MRRAYSFALLALTAMTPVFLTTASVARAPAEEQAGPQVLSDEDLSGLRGGFTTPSGVTFGFGAIIRSYIDNRLALQTQLTWTPSGLVTEQVRGDVPGMTDLASAVTTLINNGINLSAITGSPGKSAGGTGDTPAGTGGASNTGGAGGAAGTGGVGDTAGVGNPGVVGSGVETGGGGNFGAVGSGVEPGSVGGTGGLSAGAGSGGAGAGSGGAGATGGAAVSAGSGAIGNTAGTPAAGGIIGGVALVDASGATALVHNVTAGQIQSLIINNANNRNLRQDIELNLYLPDLAAMQAASSMQQRASQMTYDLNTSLVGSIR